MYILDEDKLRKTDEEEELENGDIEELATWEWKWEVSKSLKNLIDDPPDYSWWRAESAALDAVNWETFAEKLLTELTDLYECKETKSGRTTVNFSGGLPRRKEEGK